MISSTSSLPTLFSIDTSLAFPVMKSITDVDYMSGKSLVTLFSSISSAKTAFSFLVWIHFSICDSLVKMILFIDSSSPMSEDNPSNNDQWTQPALASCHILKWIGIYLCFVFIFGVVLNGSVIYVLMNKKYPRSPISTFILALSCADLTHAVLGIPLPLTSNLACRYGDNTSLVFQNSYFDLDGYMVNICVITKVLYRILLEWLDCIY